MTTTPPDKNKTPGTTQSSTESADVAAFAELTATDALLDRLGARQAGDGDLTDPAVQALAELLAEIDETRVPDVGAARLIEVLAGRPLYIAGGEAATEPWLPDVVAAGPRDESDGTDQVGTDRRDRLDATGQRVIDLTDGRDDEHDDTVAASTSSAPPTMPIARPASPEVTPIGNAASARARRWDGALPHAALPAACVLLLLAIGGGVSAAVTGDPMAPVNGISRVVAKLPGVKDDKVDAVQGEIKAARRAVITKNNEAAALHLDRARANLDAVPDAAKTDLTKQISEVAGLVPTATPGATPPGPGSGTVETTAPSASEPADTPEASPTTDPGPSTDPEPSIEPEPTTDPVPDTDPTGGPTELGSTPEAEAT